jgi:hypothetical protein
MPKTLFSTPFAHTTLAAADANTLYLADRTAAAFDAVSCIVDAKADQCSQVVQDLRLDHHEGEIVRTARRSIVGGLPGLAQRQVSCIDQTLANETQALQAAVLNAGSAITTEQLAGFTVQQQTAVIKASASKAAALSCATDAAMWEAGCFGFGWGGRYAPNQNIAPANGGSFGPGCGC